MAVKTQADVTEVSNLPGNIPINKDRYSTRCKAASAKLSRAGNPMIELEVELYSPDVIISVVNGQKYNVAGITDKVYFPLSDKALPRLFDFMKKIGLAGETGIPRIDTDISVTNTQQFVGKCWSALWGSEESIARKDLTEADKLAGKTEGDPIMMEDGVTPVKFQRSKMGTVLGGTNVQPPAF